MCLPQKYDSKIHKLMDRFTIKNCLKVKICSDTSIISVPRDSRLSAANMRETEVHFQTKGANIVENQCLKITIFV